MDTIYIISLVIVAVISSFATLCYPKVKRVIIQRKTNKKHKLNEYIRLEIERQLKEILNDN
jgi:hypothetical protein